MPRRTTAIAAALTLRALGSPLITRCAQSLERQYFNQGIEKYEEGNYQEALADFTKALEINPQSALTYYNLGVTKSALGDDQGAIADYTKALEINPKLLTTILVLLSIN